MDLPVKPLLLVAQGHPILQLPAGDWAGAFVQHMCGNNGIQKS